MKNRDVFVSVGIALVILTACAGARDDKGPVVGADRQALIIVDLQNDFCFGNDLAVEGAEQIIGLINELQPEFDLVVATQDWHPQNHLSFASNHPGRKPGDIIQVSGVDQTLWPDHCVQGSDGAKLHADLKRDRIARVFQKGTDSEIDSYSGFFDNRKRQSTGLGEYLESEGVSKVFVVGLATDYCVKYTALDARALGFVTTVIEDATRAVNLNPGDGEAALREMREAGIDVIRSSEILRSQTLAR